MAFLMLRVTWLNHTVFGIIYQKCSQGLNEQVAEIDAGTGKAFPNEDVTDSTTQAVSPSRPARKSLSAWSISSREFITNGPY